MQQSHEVWKYHYLPFILLTPTCPKAQGNGSRGTRQPHCSPFRVQKEVWGARQLCPQYCCHLRLHLEPLDLHDPTALLTHRDNRLLYKARLRCNSMKSEAESLRTKNHQIFQSKDPLNWNKPDSYWQELFAP